MFLAGSVLVMSLPFLAHGIDSKAGKFWSCFFVLFVYGPVNGIVQGTVFGLAGFLPAQYVGAVMVGNGLSGIACTLVEMLLVATLPGKSNLYAQALIFYSWATAVLLLSAAAYPFVTSSKFFQYHEKKAQVANAEKIILPDRKEEATETAAEMTFAEFMTQFKANFAATKSMLLSLMWVFVVTFVVFASAFIAAGYDFTASAGDAQ